jgi:REP element-mobilizing transposase RayT
MSNRPGHRALRKGRFSMPGQTYLVTTTTLARRPLFEDWRVACVAARALTNANLWRDARLLCWALMPDHWHGMIELCDGAALGAVVNRVKAVSAREINRAASSTGAVWAKAFHDQALRAEEDLVATARYIIANPVRAGIAKSVREYPFWDAVWLESAAPAVAETRAAPWVARGSCCL